MTQRQTVRRLDGWTVSTAAALGALLTVYPSNRLGAQVGYDPAHSPYHDMPRGAVTVASFGYLAGSRGSLGVGPANGLTGGVRYEVQFGAVGASLGLAYAQGTRFVVLPADSASKRTTGPVDDHVVLADAGFQLILTGRKTWHGFSPFVGAALGVAVGSELPRDTSGYKFGTKLTLMPNAGVRWYPARRLSIRSDLRVVFWKLRYPLSYRVPGADGTSVLSITAPLEDWTAHPWATIGVGWIF